MYGVRRGAYRVRIIILKWIFRKWMRLWVG
jgi:hypothetical protein